VGVNQGTTWQSNSTSGVFGVSGWQQMNTSPAAPANPNFSAGVVSKFGLLTKVQNFGADFQMYYDNFHLTSAHLDPTDAVPEPGPAALLIGVGLTGAAFIVRRKRRK